MDVFVGIDYSMTSPAVTVHIGNEWSFENCKFFYLTETRKQFIRDERFFANDYPVFSSDIDRFRKLGLWASNIVQKCGPASVFIEGYSMGSKGMVFNIGENTGILKYLLLDAGYKYVPFAPTEVKKFATGSGGADKMKMNDAFVEETGFDIRKHFGMSEMKKESPTADIVDSYYVCKLGWSKK